MYLINDAKLSLEHGNNKMLKNSTIKCFQKPCMKKRANKKTGTIWSKLQSGNLFNNHDFFWFEIKVNI